VNSKIQISIHELDFTYSRAGGPGGQNVNKTNSKATLKWNVWASDAVSEEIKNQIFKKFGNKINSLGELVLSSGRYRDQGRNVADCIEKLKAIVLKSAFVPKRRKKTKPSKASKEKRIKEKKHQSEKKKMRRGDH